MSDGLADSAETRRLLDQVAAGDRRALDQLMARHRPYLRQVVELRMGGAIRARVDPSDVVQETQLEAVKRMDDYLRRRPMPFHLWLRRTANERLIKIRRHARAQRRSPDREVPLPSRSSIVLAQQLLAAGPTPSQQLDQEEMARLVRQAIARLADRDREVLVMRNFEGLSYEELVTVLGIDPATARKRHGRALLHLHRELVELGFEET